MENFIDRFVKYMTYKDLNANKVTNEAGLSVGLLGSSIKNRSGLNSNTIEKILQTYSDLNPTWLLTGSGEMLITDKPKQIISELKKIPRVGVEAIGGLGNSTFSFSVSDIIEEYSVPEFNNMKADFIIGVAGNSMQPRFIPGDSVACRIIKDNARIEWGKSHVISTKEDGILLKRIRKGVDENHFILVSDNPEYDPINIKRREIDGIAVVVGILRLE